MNPNLEINERVDVVLLHYANAAERLLCVPYKMRYKGQEIVFTIFGMRHPTVKGRRMIHVFDMSDGTNDYRLEYDAERLTWMLVNITEGHHAKR